MRLVASLILVLLLSFDGVNVRAENSAQVVAPYPEDFRDFDYDTALRYSQGAIGRKLGDHRFTSAEGRSVSLSEYAGRPLIIQMVFTSCYYTCSTATKNLARLVQIGRNSLGADSFSVLTIGFDTANDTPEAMRAYARQQGVSVPNWEFLSADRQTIEALSAELGFFYFPSPRGFDHLTQASIVDGEGVVYRQVYGEAMSTPQLVEPLKQLVFGTREEQSALEALGNRVRLFCTTYDPKQDRYYFDYSLFVGIGVGIMVIGSVSAFLLREFVFRRRRRVAD
ncbi:MAG: SCO family protein [Rhodocyclaceae bacterium]|jgi:protein SCO1/2|nr:SCO family protein [Rhodocyclaceae bacterium]MCL4757027.1 SCO family protein [Rhodocyclaceae bacterium]